MKSICALLLCGVLMTPSAFAAQANVSSPDAKDAFPQGQEMSSLTYPMQMPSSPFPADGTPMVISSLDELQAALTLSFTNIIQPPVFDVSALDPEINLQIAVQNIRSSILSQHPEYKYAYDLTVEVGPNRLLTCTISYMPYRTGNYPPDFAGIEIPSMAALLQTVQGNLTKESIPIRITDPTLTVDDMNKMLQQVGGSWLLCQLSRDGTAVTITPQGGLTREEAIARLSETQALAKTIYQTLVSDGMSQWEQAEVLYTYLTQQVRYDFRYYGRPGEMPYVSTTAYGALHDHLAICGGYAQALQSLFQQAGIPCITVSGKMGSENHMWNLARIENKWYYFDATSDRGRADYGFHCFGAEADQLTRYTWNQPWVEQMIQLIDPPCSTPAPDGVSQPMCQIRPASK